MPLLGLCLGIRALLSDHWVCREGGSERLKDDHGRFVTGRAFERYKQRNGKRYGLAYSSCSCGSGASSGLGLKALATSGFGPRKGV